MKKMGFSHAISKKKKTRKRPLSAVQRKRVEEKQQRLSMMAQPRFKREKYTGPNGSRESRPATKAMKLANELMQRVAKHEKSMENTKLKRKMRPLSAPARRKVTSTSSRHGSASNKQFNLSSTDAAEKYVNRCIKRREKKIKALYAFLKSLSDAKLGLMRMPDPAVTFDTFENFVGEVQVLTLEVVASIESWRKQLLERKTLDRRNISTSDFTKPPPFMWQPKRGKPEVNYLVHITTSLDFLAQSNTTHFDSKHPENNDESSIDFKGIVLGLKPKLALVRNPFMLTTDALWADRAPFFTAERVILDEERRVSTNGHHHGHFVSFVSTNTHGTGHRHKPVQRIKSKRVENHHFHKDDHRYSPSNSSSCSSEGAASACDENDDDTPRSVGNGMHHDHMRAHSETASTHQASLVGMQSSRSAISAPNDALSLYEHRPQVATNSGTPADVKIQRLTRTVDDLKEKLMYVQSQAEFQKHMAIAGTQDLDCARNRSPPSMSKVFQLCQVALGHIDLIGKDKEAAHAEAHRPHVPQEYQNTIARVQRRPSPVQASPKTGMPQTFLRHSAEVDLQYTRQDRGKRERPYFARRLPSPPRGPPPKQALDDFVKRRQNVVRAVRQNNMAVKIQTLYRQYTAKKQLWHLKERHRYHMRILKEAYEHAMARDVIRRFMLKVARRRVFYKQWQKATVLQQWYLRLSRAYNADVKVPAVVVLQSFVRMVLSRARVGRRRMEHKATLIQNTYRSYKARNF